MQHAGEPRARRGARQLGDQLAGASLVERLEGDLGQHAVAAQVMPQPPQRMRARQLVGAIGGDDQQRQLAQRQRERRQQLDRRVVGPLQVVEQERRRALGDDRGQRAADRLDERGAIAARARLAELGEEHGEVAAQRTAAVETAGDRSQVLAQRADDRAVGRPGRRRGAAQEAHAGERLLGQPRLPDPGLAGEQEQAAAAGRGAIKRGAQSRPLELAADQHGWILRVSSDRQRARPGAVEARGDLGDEVRREAAAAGVLEDDVGALGLVDAVDLVAGDVAVAPLVRALQLRDRVVGRRGDAAKIVVGQVGRRRGSRARSGRSACGSFQGEDDPDQATDAAARCHQQDCRIATAGLPY